MDLNQIRENVGRILSDIPDHVTLMAAAKKRSKEEIDAAVKSGVTVIGGNYVKETLKVHDTYGGKVAWHLIGHLQRNKVKKAVELFDMIETLDSYRLAKEIDRKAAAINKVMPVLIEVNSGEESGKYGVMPGEVKDFAKDVSSFNNIEVRGLMTMGPFSVDPEESRPFFIRTRKIFEDIKGCSIRNVKMDFLSMGMSNSYKVAIEEGANIVRIGTFLFGSRSDL